MYDFIKFIEMLNDKPNAFKEALSLVKDDLHIGKVAIKSDDFLERLEFVFDENYVDKIIMSYVYGNYEYCFYKNSDNYKYSEEDLKDIFVLVRMFGLHHSNYALLKKETDREDYSVEVNLPNAKGYLKRISTIIKVFKASEYNSYYINLKGFGFINRLYNYQIGDSAIKYYANVLRNFVDESCEVAGHLGGDNFVAFIKKTRHDEFVKLVTNVSVDLNLNNNRISINLVGIVGYEDIENDDYNYRSSIPNSAIAFQYAKATKKPIVKLTPDLLGMVMSIKNIEHTFKDELKNGNFVVYYQPKFDIETGKIVGVEALSRWINNGKIVPPSMFIPVLEKNGDIVDLDLYVLENLCKDIHNFRNLGNKIVPASCNLSRKDFECEDLEDRIINIIRKYNVKTEDIVIEVTETTTLEENERLSRFINTMWKNGILTSIDDFGIGYSSLSALRDFKVNEIKIDRSFINRDTISESDEIIIGSIIDMAKKLNVDVICEGVETKKQADFLTKLGCFRAQGYYYSKPLPKLEFEDLLTANRKKFK